MQCFESHWEFEVHAFPFALAAHTSKEEKIKTMTIKPIQKLLTYFAPARKTDFFILLVSRL
jgi:hypothetical protein